MSALRVGYVVKRFPRSSETFIAQEILELERQGVEVTVLALRPNDDPAPHGWLAGLRAEVHVMRSPTLREAWEELHVRFQAGGALREGAREVLEIAFDSPLPRCRRYLLEALAVAAAAPDVDHLHAHFANQPAAVALLAHHLGGVPFSFTAHAKDLYAAAPPLSLLARQVRDAAFVVTVSEDNRRHLAGLLGADGVAGVRTLPNGVDLEAFRPDAAARQASGPPEVLCVARLVEKKGIDVLLLALASLTGRGVELRATVVGDGPQESALRDRASDLGLGDRVAFTGLLPHEEVARRMRRAHLFVLPAVQAADGDRDALPTVLLEAMACGLPCVSTLVGGIPEIVVPHQTGLLVPGGNPWALAEALGELLRRPAAARRMGKAGRDRAARLFDRRRSVARLHAWMLEAVRGQAAGRVSLEAIEV